MIKHTALVLAVVINLIAHSLCDLPVHCMPDTTPGRWTFQLTEQNLSGKEATTKCGLRTSITPVHNFNVTLSAPNVAKDDNGNVGDWHNVYDQGFEVVIGEKKYFAFFEYEEDGKNVVSKCGSTLTGWYHEVGVAAKKWCYRAKKLDAVMPLVHPSIDSLPPQNDVVTADQINKVAETWVAEDYAENYDDKLVPLRRMKALMPNNRLAVPIPDNKNSDLPKSIDWRNISGVSFVSPVRNQMSCGSCFSFASTAAVEAAINIASKNTHQVVLSPQDIVSCSVYSQGCKGGFPYLVFKYGEDFGFQSEKCYPYEGRDSACTKDKCPGDKRQHVTNYQYIGGYVGASNEQNIMEALQKGPVVLNFLVYADFSRYRGGIYKRASSQIKGGHSVLGVGYGEDEHGTKYYIVKNSWGPTWGEQGFFRIRRGTDEAGIESMGPSFATAVL